MVNAIPVRLERMMERRQVDALINADPTQIVLKRKTKVSAPGGGWRWGPEIELPPQEVTLMPFVRRMTDFIINTELGQIPNLAYILVGRHYLDIERLDTFHYQGDLFEVKELDFKQDVRIAAQIIYYGADQDG